MYRSGKYFCKKCKEEKGKVMLQETTEFNHSVYRGISQFCIFTMLLKPPQGL